jgi:hypothetical protein
MVTALNAIEVEPEKKPRHFTSALTNPRVTTQHASDERPRVEQSVEFHQRVGEARAPDREGA